MQTKTTFDLAQVTDLLDHGPDWISHRAIRVSGVDGSVVPRDWDPDRDVVPGRLTVTGRWTGETLQVDGHTWKIEGEFLARRMTE